jgi:hypothetical protein
MIGGEASLTDETEGSPWILGVWHNPNISTLYD